MLLILAKPRISSTRIYIQPMSNSCHFEDSLLRTVLQHLAQAARLRAVRIIHGLAASAVRALDRRPCPGDHSGPEPKPEAKEMLRQRMQLDCTVRLMTMQEDGDRDDGDQGQTQANEHAALPGEIE